MDLRLATGPSVAQAPLSGQRPALDRQTRLLVVAPHPDDETIAAGQLIQRVRLAGGHVHVLVLTNGDNNPWPQRWLERRLRIGPRERLRWAARRRGELLHALAWLGVPEQDVHLLGWPDLGLTERMESHGRAMLASLIEVLSSFRPNLVVAPDMADRHPDHGASHVLVRLALERWGRPHRLLCYLVHGQARTSARSLAWPSLPALQENKERAIHCHRTQTALSGRRLLQYVRQEERFRLLQPGARAGVLPWRIRSPLGATLRFTLAHAGGIDGWSWPDAPVACRDDGSLIVQSPGARPCFAKLRSRLPSPWIFDHWGWHEL